MGIGVAESSVRGSIRARGLREQREVELVKEWREAVGLFT